jgi:hypothetical protein
MTFPKTNPLPPTVELIGRFDHEDFRDAASLLRAQAQLETATRAAPELVVVAQSRPGEFRQREIELLQRRWPISGIVALLGSCCEGETRTGRPWPGVKRLYWYEFPAWWRRQLKLRSAGRCPDWARPPHVGAPIPTIDSRGAGVIVLSAGHRNPADALADILRDAGYATLWQPPGRPAAVVRGAVAGIWDGGQLNDCEINDLAKFCQRLARDNAPVIALLDFPRRDAIDHALAVGVAVVFGKPYLNADLVTTIENIAKLPMPTDKLAFVRAA